MHRILATALALVLASTSAFATSEKASEEKITTTTTVTKSSSSNESESVPGKLEPNTRAIHFEDYDLDRDGNLTQNEAGEMLFRLYDTDGNQIIDDNEYLRKAVLSKSPVLKKSRSVVDENADGTPEKDDASEETTFVDTMLSQYDKDGDGLSPQEFTGKAFNKIDVNKSQAIEKREWQGVYDEKINASNRAAARLNK